MALQSIRRQRLDRNGGSSRRKRRLFLEELEALCLLSGGTVTAGPLTPPLAPPVSSELVSLTNPNQNLLSDPTDPTFDNGNLFVPNIASNTIAEVSTTGQVSTFLNSTLTGAGGSTVNLSTPDGVAFDSAGDIYIANFHGSGNSAIVEVTPQGTAIPYADIPNPNGPVFDSHGNLFVCDKYDNEIFEVPAGGGTPFVYTDNAMLDSQHQLSQPIDLAFDSTGALYVASAGNNAIYKLTGPTQAKTVGSAGTFNGPTSEAIGPGDTLYVYNSGSNAITQVTVGGEINSYTVQSGGGAFGGLAVDPAGNLYVANSGNSTVSVVTSPPLTVGEAFTNQTVFHFTDSDTSAPASQFTAAMTLGDGNTVTLTGSGVQGTAPAGAGGQIVAAPEGGFDVQLSYTYTEPLDATFAATVTDTASGSTASATTNSLTVTAMPNPLTAGALTPPGSSASSGPAAPTEIVANNQQIRNPTDPVFSNGYLYVPNSGNGSVSQVSPTGVVTGGSTPFINAGLNVPVGIAVYNGNIYVTNFGGTNTVSEAPLQGGTATAYIQNYSNPNGVAFDSQGNLFFCQKGQNEIFEVPAGTTSPMEYVQNSMLPAGSPQLSGPIDLVIDGGNLYVASATNNTIDEVTGKNQIKTVPSGNLLSEPNSLAVDPANNDLYVYNGGNGNIIDVPTAAGGTPTTYYTAGSTVYQQSGEFAGLAFDPAGNLYVAYYGNNTIWKFAASGSSSLYEGQSFPEQTVFHFTDSNSSDTASQFTAQITLGDGKTFNIGPGATPLPGASGQIVKDASGGFDVQLGYTYAEPLSGAPFSVTVTGPESGATATSMPGTVTVLDQPLTGSSTATATGAAGATNGTVLSGATFTDAKPGDYTGDFSAMINWGDNTSPSPATGITYNGGVYTVSGSHTYSAQGPYSITITVTDSGGKTATITGTATVTAGTTASAPAVTTTGATTATSTTETVNGRVNPNGSPTSTLFVYSTDPSLRTDVVTTLAGTASQTGGDSNGIGAAASFNSPEDVRVDASGNVYVADTGNDAIRKITTSNGVATVSTLAGRPGVSGYVNGTGGNAKFDSPEGLAVDAAGNLYVADTFNNTIREITTSPAGVVTVTTLAGQPGVSGHADGTGTAATFDSPEGVAVDAAGNVYVADTGNDTIRKITISNGVVTVSTLAGQPGVPGTANGTGTAAQFDEPTDVAVDASGNVYVADKGNSTLREITSVGVVTTIAGSPGVPGNSDGMGSAAHFDLPDAVAVDAAGNVYVSDRGNDTIREVAPDGMVTTIAGAAGQAGSTDGTKGAARFDSPEGLGSDAAGNVYVADTFNNTIREVSGAAILAAQTGVTGTSSQNISATLMGLTPGATYYYQAAGTNGIGTNQGSIQSFVAGATTNTLTAGALTPPSGSATGAPTPVQFVGPPSSPLNAPTDPVFQNGDIYVLNIGTNTVSQVSLAAAVTTAPGSQDAVINPTHLAVDPAGNLYIGNGSSITKVTPQGAATPYVSGLISPFSLVCGPDGTLYFQVVSNGIMEVPPGGGTPVPYLYNQPTSTEFFQLAADGAGNLYSADQYTDSIDEVTGPNQIKTITSGDLLNVPTEVAFNPVNGDVYVYNFGNSNIIQVTPAGTQMVYCSLGSSNVYTQSGTAPVMAFDSAGNLYLSSDSNNTLYKIVPAVSSLTVGQSFTNQTVFHFTDSNSSDTAGQFKAQIMLGDGNTFTFDNNGPITGTTVPPGASGQIVPDAGGFDVQLSYTYTEPLTSAPFSVMVTDTASGATTTSMPGTVTVTGGLRPTVMTPMPATDITDTTADVPATINPEGSVTTVTVVYGTDSSLSSGTLTSAGTDASDGAVAEVLTLGLFDLAPDTTYYYEVMATSTAGTTTGTISHFTTAAAIATEIDATAGTTQSATAGTAFATALGATVVDQNGDPLPGAKVTFTAPSGGPSGSFSNGQNTVTVTTDSSGMATASFVANASAGNYIVTASVAGVSPSATFSLTNTAPPPATINFAAGQYSANATDPSTPITLTRAGNLSATVTVVLSSPGGTDVAGIQQTVTFGPGMTTETVPVPIQNDGKPQEPDATIPFSLSSPGSGATLGAPSAANLIVHDNNPLPPPVTVTLQLTQVKVTTGTGKRAKTTTETGLELIFSGPINGAGNLGAYHVFSGKTKKGVTTFSQPVPLSSVVYNPATRIAMVAPRNKLNLAVPEQIQLTAALLTDNYGRPLDGKHSGQPGSNFAANFSNKGIQAAAVDAILEGGL